jgi:apolipoprotein N-acyltransferase
LLALAPVVTSSRSSDASSGVFSACYFWWLHIPSRDFSLFIFWWLHIPSRHFSLFIFAIFAPEFVAGGGIWGGFVFRLRFCSANHLRIWD